MENKQVSCFCNFHYTNMIINIKRFEVMVSVLLGRYYTKPICWLPTVGALSEFAISQPIYRICLE